MEENRVRLDIFDNEEVVVRTMEEEEFQEYTKGKQRTLGEYRGFRFLDCDACKGEEGHYFIMYNIPSGITYYKVDFRVFYNLIALHILKDEGSLLRTLSEVRGALINIGG